MCLTIEDPPLCLSNSDFQQWIISNHDFSQPLMGWWWIRENSCAVFGTVSVGGTDGAMDSGGEGYEAFIAGGNLMLCSLTLNFICE
ncbi:hypothetical protein GIB67_018412 [Kingdonia uniflora]|uniref:Uncharacterized protein n=1 Tax=Kingdonia uniflora TaxID=39325 RepID=A0A7J7MJ75_9MAGN|nr:hypothetical protein GIB67_018412 [Kingdonia uniflora]